MSDSDSIQGEGDEAKTHAVLNAEPGAYTLEGGQASFWLWTSFASKWYADALREARQSGQDARRREIVFAVSAAECYLFERVRDNVLPHDVAKLNGYFPPDPPFRGIAEKWKCVPRQLLYNELIVATPDLSGTTYQQFTRLADFRNGLVHARASRPRTEGLPPKAMPVPTAEDLAQLEPGWAARTVTALIRELHAAAGTPPPTWLEPATN